MNSYRIDIGDQNAPIFSFSSEDESILKIVRNTGIDLVSDNLTIDRFEPVTAYVRYDAEAFAPADYDLIVTSDNKVFCTNKVYGDLRFVPYGTTVRFYKNGLLAGKFYVSNVTRTSRFEYKIDCTSAIGLFNSQQHFGGLYRGETFEEVVSEIIGGVVPFSCEEDVRDVQIYGWLPYGTKRQNLHHLLFATNATLSKDASGDIRFSFIYSTDPDVIPEDKVEINGKADYGSPVSDVIVTEHSWVELSTDTEQVLFDNSASGDVANHLIIVFENAPIHGVKVDGIPVSSVPTTINSMTVEALGVNYAIVSGIGLVSGQPYTHLMNELHKNILYGGEQRTRAFRESWLVNAINSENVAQRLLSYFSARKILTGNIVTDEEQCGRKVAITDAFYEAEEGFITSMNIVSSGIELAECEIITDYTPQGQGNAYTDSVLLTGSGTWQIPQSVLSKPNPIIKAILIGGGQGAQSSGASSAGENGAVNHSGNGGEGGEIGDSGEGGKILAVTIDCTGLTSITYNCGARGEGGVPNGTQPHDGSLGGDTTIVAGDTSYNSANGVSNVNGYQNIFTGEVYARKGTQDAIKGGKGGQSDARQGEGYPAESVSADGQTWQGGQQGALNYDGSNLAGGGAGSGAVRGQDGANGQNGSSGGYAGNGANGVTPARRADASVIGQGGSATDSPSGGGGGGATSVQDWGVYDRHYGLGGQSAQGQYGARGGVGGVLFYI